MKAIILCGGGGTRLWPESTPAVPKQFLRLFGERSLLADTVLRLLPIMRPEDIVLVTGERYEAAARAELEAIGCGQAKIVCEPAARNTAPAIALGVSYLTDVAGVSENETIFVAPSDHVIADGKEFYDCLRVADDFARQDSFVTFGIVPDYPETGYGYIEAGQKLGAGFVIRNFKEKPDRLTAESYIADGNYYWNSGMFMFRAGLFMQQLNKYAPEIAAGFSGGYHSALAGFCETPKISVDYAIAERTDCAVVVPLAAGWNDAGSWDAVYDISSKDGNNNVIVGAAACLDCHNVLVRTSHRKLAVIGMNDAIVVETADAVLVVKRGASQKVKDILENS